MHHSLNICYDIAEKLKDPEKTIELMTQVNLANGWSEYSFAWGISGIICYYAMMNLNFENEGWDQVAHDYLKLTKVHLESIGDINPSLFFGLAGLSFSVYLCSENGKRYQKTLTKLDELFAQQVRERFLDYLNHYLDPYTPVPHYYYDLASGLSGIISYLIHRDDLAELRSECVDCLVQVLSRTKISDSHPVLPWLISTRSNNGMEEPYKEGFYRLDIPYGIPGVLGSLSQAAIKGVRTSGLIELIATISDWIKNVQLINHDMIYWNRFVPVESHSEEKVDVKNNGNDWFLGVLAISKCLHTASKVLNQHELSNRYENVFVSQLQRFPQYCKTMDPSFSLGKAGLLSLAYQMGCETEKPIYFKIAREIEEEIKRSFHPLHKFGFQTLQKGANWNSPWIDSPGLYSGATGIALSLLQAQGRIKMPWNLIFHS